MQVLLGRGAYAPWVRENLVQAQYFKVRGGGSRKKEGRGQETIGGVFMKLETTS
jgi:hypothetical protein